MTGNAPWQQQAPPPTTQAPPTGPTSQLQLVRQELQKEIEVYGVTDQMEIEFGSVVKRLMESCTKDSIAVREKKRKFFFERHSAFVNFVHFLW